MIRELKELEDHLPPWLKRFIKMTGGMSTVRMVPMSVVRFVLARARERNWRFRPGENGFGRRSREVVFFVPVKALWK